MRAENGDEWFYKKGAPHGRRGDADMRRQAREEDTSRRRSNYHVARGNETTRGNIDCSDEED